MEPDVLKFIGDYGIIGFLLYFFVKEFFAYLNKNKVADTLKDANKDRKDDTNRVAERLNTENNSQDIAIVSLQKDIDFVKLQVSNHLPTAISEIKEELKKHDEDERKMWKIIMQIAIKNGIDISNY